MVMNTLAYKGNKAFGTAILLAMLLTAFAAFAQDEVEDIGPAVDTSALEPQEIESATPDSFEPAVDTSATGNGVTRRTTGNRVMDSMELGRTEITGNQELPKVMYIVPWQKANPGDLMGRPINTLLDEVLAPIDREEFLRQVDYYDGLYGSKQE
jgi:hypothetical protein